MKHHLSSFKVGTKLKCELPKDIEMECIPLMGLYGIHDKTREASQNTDCGLREFLGINKALQMMQGVN